MVRIQRLGCILVLIGMAGLVAQSQEKGSEYVSPSEAAPGGKAPKMQVQLLNPGTRQNNTRLSSIRETRLFPDCWNLLKNITLRVHISPLLGHSMEPCWAGSIPNAKCTRRFPSKASTK